jgi:hypothetical protein
VDALAPVVVAVWLIACGAAVNDAAAAAETSMMVLKLLIL